MTDPAQSDDGLQQILELEYDLEDLRKYTKESCLAEKCAFLFLEESSDVEKICKEFLTLLENERELNLDEITTLFVVVSRLYYMKPTPENLECRMHLLYKTFRYVDTLHPVHIHVATKRLLEGLKLDNIQLVFNLLGLCHHISAASETGRAIAICLMWAILDEIAETEIEMHCFRGLSELLKMLQDIDEEMLQSEENTHIVYILVKVVGFIINSIVFAPKEDFKKAGYRTCFTYSKRDLEKVKEWADRLSEKMSVKVTSEQKSCWALTMTIKEYLDLNIRTLLYDKISAI